MIGYVTLGTNNLKRAAKFYDELLGSMGARRLMESDTFVMWGTSETAPTISATKPYNGLPATVGNGTMIALAAKSKKEVDAVHKKALSLGAVDEGAAGPRAEDFYAGFFRDPDGNKLAVFFLG